MGLLTDLEDFVYDHRPHGPLTGDATEPAWNGYLLTVTCPCGVVFERWVTPIEAEGDLMASCMLSSRTPSVSQSLPHICMVVSRLMWKFSVGLPVLLQMSSRNPEPRRPPRL